MRRFHVDKLSSAHVYLRLPQGMTWDAIPQDVLQECCQLVKANSIEGANQSWNQYHASLELACRLEYAFKAVLEIFMLFEAYRHRLEYAFKAVLEIVVLF